MSIESKQLFDSALQLPDSERSELAAWLIASLDTSTEDDVEAAWSIEIQRRISELDSGQAKTIPWPEARRIITRQSDGT